MLRNRLRKGQYMRSMLVCASLLLLFSACQSGPAQLALQSPIHSVHIDGTSEVRTGSPQALQFQPHLTVIKGTATPTQPHITGSPPGQVPSGSGSVPTGMPHYFSFGVNSGLGLASQLDAQRSQNGTAYAFRYQYLTGGVNTGQGWEQWIKPGYPGEVATTYMQENADHGYMPVFTYYEMCLSNGPHPGAYCDSGHNVEQIVGNMNTPQTMNAYFANWVLLMQKIGAFGKPVLVIVEPDMWGFLQNAANGTDNAATVSAAVSSSGYPDVAGFPNTVQGFAWAMLHLRDKYARNAILALHASCWAPGEDIGTDTNPNVDVAGAAHRLANFLNTAGLYGNPAGVSSWDLLSNDVAGPWWDRYNRTFPNFSRYLTFIGDVSQYAHRRVVMWQIPMGNQYFDTMNNTQWHQQDNRAEYILGNVSSFARAGIIAVLFGGGSSPIDDAHDGVTNPAPISTYECSYCNTHKSIYADDDGGYLRIFIGLYMQHPVPV